MVGPRAPLEQTRQTSGSTESVSCTFLTSDRQSHPRHKTLHRCLLHSAPHPRPPPHHLSWPPVHLNGALLLCQKCHHPAADPPPFLHLHDRQTVPLQRRIESQLGQHPLPAACFSDWTSVYCSQGGTPCCTHPTTAWTRSRSAPSCSGT